jgi:uncharacterized NAD(P)/FAD-binding protein YdhS
MLVPYSQTLPYPTDALRRSRHYFNLERPQLKLRYMQWLRYSLSTTFTSQGGRTSSGSPSKTTGHCLPFARIWTEFSGDRRDQVQWLTCGDDPWYGRRRDNPEYLREQRFRKFLKSQPTNRCSRFCEPAGFDSARPHLQASLREEEQVAKWIDANVEKVTLAYLNREVRAVA